MSNYYGPKPPSNHRIIWTCIAVFLGLVLVTWAAWAISVAISGPKGQGDAIIKKNSAENWTAAQAQFEEDYQSIIAADSKIAVHQAALDADPDNPTLRTNLTGITTACIGQVAKYNAEARKFLSEDFRAADLPAQISETDPNTDCK